jgi:hypothetical protein
VVLCGTHVHHDLLDRSATIASTGAMETGTSLPIRVNRAPVLTLWAAIVAERLGYTPDTALTLSRFVAGSSARAKARRLGIADEAQEAACTSRIQRSPLDRWDSRLRGILPSSGAVTSRSLAEPRQTGGAGLP